MSTKKERGQPRIARTTGALFFSFVFYVSFVVVSFSSHPCLIRENLWLLFRLFQKGNMMCNIYAGHAAWSGLAIAVACLAVCYSGPAICNGASTEQDIEKMVADFNTRLPWQIDAVTRLDRLEVLPGNAYSYCYTLNTNLTDAQKQQLQETTARKALAAPDMQPIFKAGVTVWYKYFDSAGKKVLEFPVKGEAVADPEHDAAYQWGYKVGYWIGVFGGALLVGALCGALPLCVGMRRGRTTLAVAAMITCGVAGLVLGVLLAAPTALVFTVVILALPRVVPQSNVVEAEAVE